MLLDTRVLLWALGDPARLNGTVRELLEDATSEVLFSAASIWEIAIKASLERADFAVRPEQVAQAARMTGFVELPINADVAAPATDLPVRHRDPFDRLMTAQAMAEPARFYTVDPLLPPYPELVELIE